MADVENPAGAAGPPTAVPPLVNYGDQRLPAIRAGHRRVRAPATNAGSVGPGLVTWIQLDTSQLGAFLDPHNSYLQFDLQMTGMTVENTRTLYALLSNSGAAAFIDTLRIYVQGNCIEEITNYGALQELLCDMNGNAQPLFNPPIIGGADVDASTWSAVGAVAGAAATVPLTARPTTPAA